MKKFLIALIILLVLVIGLEIGILVYRDYTAEPTEPTTVPTTEITEAPTTVPTETTQAATEAPTTVPTTVATEAPTEAPTTVPTEAPTQPTEPETTKYLLSFAGNCTLGSTKKDASNPASFISVVGENYGYPFANVASYFKADDFTMVNLEGVLADDGTAIGKEFTFIGPSAYAQILTQGGVELVSVANDHTRDFGSAGYTDTKTTLEAEGVSYVEDNSSRLYTTGSGLKIGVYAVHGTLDRSDMRATINQLNQNGAEVIVVFFHWSNSSSYAPSAIQTTSARAAVDDGADIVIGTGSNVLQRIENYKDRYICYSLGNFSYGGSKWPADRDTVLVQLEVLRNKSGKIEIGELNIIPCSMTSSGNSQNNFQPTPLDSGDAQYNSILRKLSNRPSSGTTASTGSTEATDGTTASTEKPVEPTNVPTVAPSTETTATPTEAPVEPTVATTEPAAEPTTAPDYGSNDVPDVNDPEA